MRIRVVCSLALSPTCLYNFGVGVQEGSSVVVSNSLLSLLPLIRWNQTGPSSLLELRKHWLSVCKITISLKIIMSLRGKRARTFYTVLYPKLKGAFLI